MALPRDRDNGSYSRRVGLYSIEWWTRSPDGTISLTTGEGLGVWTGLVLSYAPPGTPLPQRDDDDHLLDERWSWTTIDYF